MPGIVPSRLTEIALPVIADSEAMMADPSEVPPETLRRPIAAAASAWSRLGRLVTSAPCSKATTPISMLSGCAVMNDRAARCAAASRSGATSLAPMLLDTSMATMTVPDARGTGSDAAGPATAIASTTMPAIVSHTPACRARPGPATPAAASAAARRRETATARKPRAAATSRPTASSAGEASVMRACDGFG